MNRLLKTVFLLGAVAVNAIPAYGQCATNRAYSHLATVGTFWTGYTNDPSAGGIGGVSLIVGQGNPASGSGKDSNIYPMTASGCGDVSACQSRLISGNFRVSGTTAQASNAWDVCPLTTENLTVIMWERAGEGSSSHTGSFVAATAKWVSTKWEFAQPMSPQNNKVFQQFPTVSIINAYSDGGGNYHFDLRIPIPAAFPTQTNTAFKRQYYDSTIGTPPVVVAGWNLYRRESATAPTTGDIASGGWVFMGTVTIPEDSNAYVDYTTTSFSVGANPVYFAVAPEFADGFTPFTTYGNPHSGYFVGPNSAALNPPTAPTQMSTSAIDNNVSTDTGVDVTWADPSDWGDGGLNTSGRGFNVWRQAVAPPYSTVKLNGSPLSASTHAYNDSTGTNRSLYTYYVEAFNGFGLSTNYTSSSQVQDGVALGISLRTPSASYYGNNWVSLPFINSYSPASVAFSSIPNCTEGDCELDFYDATTDTWLIYDGLFFTDDFPIPPTSAFFVRVFVSSSTWNVVGSHDPTQAVYLYKTWWNNTGANIRSIPYNSTSTTASQLFMEIPNCTELCRWDDQLGGFRVYDNAINNFDDFPITAGVPVVIKVTADTVWYPSFY